LLIVTHFASATNRDFSSQDACLRVSHLPVGLSMRFQNGQMKPLQQQRESLLMIQKFRFNFTIISNKF